MFDAAAGREEPTREVGPSLTADTTDWPFGGDEEGPSGPFSRNQTEPKLALPCRFPALGWPRTEPSQWEVQWPSLLGLARLGRA